MMKNISLLLLLLNAQATFAALPPKSQNIKDLDVIVGFIKQHERIMTTLESVDFVNYTIYYSNGCKAIFWRKYSAKPLGWAGPADSLEIKGSTCGVDY
jgi:hypothetical protein